MESFRLGVIIGHSDEQFLQFWMAIEILAEGTKDPALVPITCPTCSLNTASRIASCAGGHSLCEYVPMSPPRGPLAAASESERATVAKSAPPSMLRHSSSARPRASNSERVIDSGACVAPS